MRTVRISSALAVVALLAAMAGGPMFRLNEHEAVERVTEGAAALRSAIDRFIDPSLFPSSSDWDTDGVAAIEYVHGRAVRWSTASVPFGIGPEGRGLPDTGIVTLPDGQYLRQVVEHGDTLRCIVGLVRHRYAFSNTYLNDGWGPHFELPPSMRLSVADTGGVVVPALGSEFHLVAGDPVGDPQPLLPALLWCAAICAVVVLLWQLSFRFAFSPFGGAAIFTAGLVLLRVLLLLKGPEALVSSGLFRPDVHASGPFTSSLADVLLHLACLLLISARWLSVTAHLRSVSVNGSMGFIIALAHLSAWPLVGAIIRDSSFPTDLSDPFNLNAYSIWAVVAVGLWAGTMALLTFFWTHVCRNEGPFRAMLFGIVLAALGLLLMPWYTAAVTGASMALVVWQLQRVTHRASSKWSFAAFLPAIIGYAALTTAMWAARLDAAELDTRLNLAESIDEGNDPVSEFLFAQVREDILADRVLRNCIAVVPQRNEELLARVHRLFLYEQWQDYEVGVDLFGADGLLLASDQGPGGKNFNELTALHDAGTITMTRGYNQMPGEGRGYLARIDLDDRRGRNQGHVLYITLRPRALLNQTGLAALLIDGSVSRRLLPERYSVARYENGQLLESKGDCPYSVSLSTARPDSAGSLHWHMDGHSHLARWHTDGHVVIISQAEGTLPAGLAAFPYVLIAFLLLGMMAFALLRGPGALVGHWDSLRTRINLSLTGTIAATFILMGSATVYFVVGRQQAREEAHLLDRARSVQIEIAGKIKDRDSLSVIDGEVLNRLLSRFSIIFGSDINLYLPDGRLLATSRPRLYESGLRAPLIDPTAFGALSGASLTSVVQYEQIGAMRHLAAYVPVRNDSGHVLGYIGLPYYARQEAVRREAGLLISTLMNLFVLLLVVAVAVALALAERITGPLRVMRESLHGLRLQGGNRAVVWHGDDEVGELVREYNRTLNELVRSAEMLARSERESAWREMARQVAHEIKNPLTPMRLGIQMLQRSQADGAPDLPERTERMCKTLIEQIDSLSNIASAFSDFAQMPRPEMQSVDLAAVLSGVHDLHRNQPGMHIGLSVPDGPVVVRADRDQLIRIFNNLIKNAIQAIPDDREGRIEIILRVDENNATASVCDNGSGMTLEVRERIFVPRFSTKSSGMGLGLAMVKGMVEGMGGTISLETVPDQGTTFYVQLGLERTE